MRLNQDYPDCHQSEECNSKLGNVEVELLAIVCRNPHFFDSILVRQNVPDPRTDLESLILWLVKSLTPAQNEQSVLLFADVLLGLQCLRARMFAFPPKVVL